ncbi:MAG: hypothetical protein AAF089_04130 [Bacteroidota bacterium]
MDWITHTQDTMRSWAESQQRIVEQMMDAMAPFTANAATKPFEQTLAAWESSVTKSMETQADFFEAWTAQMADLDGLPEAAHEQLRQGKAAYEQFTATQQQLWSQWFDAMRRMDLRAFTGDAETEARKAFATWQDVTQQWVAQSQKAMDDALAAFKTE